MNKIPAINTGAPTLHPVNDNGSDARPPKKVRRTKKLVSKKSQEARKERELAEYWGEGMMAKKKTEEALSEKTLDGSDLPTHTHVPPIKSGLSQLVQESTDSISPKARTMSSLGRVAEKVGKRSTEGISRADTPRDLTLEEAIREVRSQMKSVNPPRLPAADNATFNSTRTSDLRHTIKPRKSWYSHLKDWLWGTKNSHETPEEAKTWATPDRTWGQGREVTPQGHSLYNAIHASRQQGLAEAGQILTTEKQRTLLQGRWWAGVSEKARLALTFALVAAPGVLKSMAIVGAAGSVGIAAPIAVGAIAGYMSYKRARKEGLELPQALTRAFYSGAATGAASFIISEAVANLIWSYTGAPVSVAPDPEFSTLAPKPSAEVSEFKTNKVTTFMINGATPGSEFTPPKPELDMSALQGPGDSPEAFANGNVAASEVARTEPFEVKRGSAAAKYGIDGLVKSEPGLVQFATSFSDQGRLQLTDALRRVLTDPAMAEQFTGAADRIVQSNGGADLVFKAGDRLNLALFNHVGFREALAETIITHEKQFSKEILQHMVEMGGAKDMSAADAVRKILKI